MISFLEVQKEKIEEISKALAKEIASGEECAEVSEISDILNGYSDMMDENLDTGVGASISHGCLLLRIFDMGRYFFVFPFAITDDAEPMDALDVCRAYAVKEELAFLIVDVPCEYIGELVCAFTHTDVSALDPSRSSFSVRAYSECESIKEVPEIADGGLRLLALCDRDKAEYAALCRDDEVNKYWGYDYRDEVKSPDDSYFYDAQRVELERGEALTLAVRWRDHFIGEAVLYHFDLKGGAQVGFRLHKRYHGHGLGARTLSLLMKCARKIGLSYVTASVLKENLASVKLLTKKMTLVGEDELTIHFASDVI